VTSRVYGCAVDQSRQSHSYSVPQLLLITKSDLTLVIYLSPQGGSVLEDVSKVGLVQELLLCNVYFAPIPKDVAELAELHPRFIPVSRLGLTF